MRMWPRRGRGDGIGDGRSEPPEDVEVGCAFCGDGIPYTDEDPIALGIVERWRPYNERPDSTVYAHRACFLAALDEEVRESLRVPHFSYPQDE